jgi:hypothetical protein
MRSIAVYQSKMAHHHGWSLLHLPAWGSVRDFFRKRLLSIRNADLAVREGKAMLLLQERLVGSNGIKDLRVDESRTEQDVGIVRMFLVSSKALTDQEKAVVHATVDKVNGRYGTHIYAFISSRKEKFDDRRKE